MGRKRIVDEHLSLGLPAGTLDRFKAVLLPGEKQASVARDLVIAEIARREGGDLPPASLLKRYLLTEGGIAEVMALIARVMESPEFRSQFLDEKA